ncbi:MAG: putative sugar O-methyltransferase, partial [Synergistaceae bacterium]|nr:putative sugar O-methyltransferase [Synergistaceae bacterium]
RICGEDIMLSTSTIRYVKVLGDVVSMFDAGEVRSVAEIGAGYGGQCRIMMSRHSGMSIEQYTLIDLPEVVGLCERYLRNFPECRENIRYVDGGHMYLPDESYDLVMSNYAFSELNRDVQDMYLERIVRRSKRGYMVWNDCSERELNGYSVSEFMSLMPGSSRIEIDYPGTCLIVWGRKNGA